ncbi:hypothetical protein DSO57_1033675 [Entomophthora muscae]|uniref:Uncharacterized protein n=1 Tax=Entomophthora muscae TaxID=34485 RepID=A0ACC2SPC9_9FUNG|nr:hypothetical protein DSO57_1033675 [Entomophthora muscae]
MISLDCLFLLHGLIHLVSACESLIPEKSGQAVLQSTGPAAQRNPGLGFDSCPQARVSREEELSILIKSQILPEITSLPIEEDIADLPIVSTVLNLGSGPRLVAYPLGTPDLEKVIAVALEIASNGAIPCLQL